jgi:pimeloyl-ACP methyl ester carboxylesterase
MTTAELRDGIYIRCRKPAKAKLHLWFFHGFGESSLSFREAFEQLAASDELALFAPDNPGAGASTARDRDFTGLYLKLIRELSGANEIGLVAHSLGGVVATALARALGGQVRHFASLEGNLTRADAFYSGQARNFTKPEEFHAWLEAKVFAMAQEGGDALRRYSASLRFCDPASLHAWAIAATSAAGDTAHGDAFAALTCPKTYLWGAKSTPKQTQDFLQRSGLPNIKFEDRGHWLMIEDPAQVYGEIRRLMRNRPSGRL